MDDEALIVIGLIALLGLWCLAELTNWMRRMTLDAFGEGHPTHTLRSFPVAPEVLADLFAQAELPMRAAGYRLEDRTPDGVSWLWGTTNKITSMDRLGHFFQLGIAATDKGSASQLTVAVRAKSVSWPAMREEGLIEFERALRQSIASVPGSPLDHSGNRRPASAS